MDRKTLLVPVALALVAFSGCVGAEGASTLYVKDALTDDVAEVHVTFTKAQVKAAEGGWTTIFDGVTTIELLSLSAADAKAELATFNLADGDYDGLRIAISTVEITHHDNTTQLLNVFGNIVQIAEEFTVTDGAIDILVDFDLDEGVDLDAGTYTPVVKDVQTSDDDADNDGLDDVEDTDDDGDGETDDVDDDADGDDKDDAPRQHFAQTSEAACGEEKRLATAEAKSEYDEEVAEAAAERDAVLSDPNATDAARAAAEAEYEAEVEEARAEHDAELEEIKAEHQDCLHEDDGHERGRPDHAGAPSDDDGSEHGADDDDAEHGVDDDDASGGPDDDAGHAADDDDTADARASEGEGSDATGDEPE